MAQATPGWGLLVINIILLPMKLGSNLHIRQLYICRFLREQFGTKKFQPWYLTNKHILNQAWCIKRSLCSYWIYPVKHYSKRNPNLAAGKLFIFMQKQPLQSNFHFSPTKVKKVVFSSILGNCYYICQELPIFAGTVLNRLYLVGRIAHLYFINLLFSINGQLLCLPGFGE